MLWPADESGRRDSAKRAESAEAAPAHPRFSQRNKNYFFQSLFLRSFEHVQRHRVPWPVVADRWNGTLAAFESDGWTVERKSLRLTSRMTVGNDRIGLLDGGGLSINRTFGYPVIPGSSIKGAIRRAAALSPELADPALVERILGKPGGVASKAHGEVTFFDAIPNRRLTHLEIDAANCHYPEYYSSGVAPADDQQPEVEYFLAIPAGTEFLFAIGSDATDSAQLIAGAMKLLDEVLSQTGLGSHTSNGYGRFAAGAPAAV
ncbi:MAG: type III-B CRISPR module RAMP protein Cmr6 [Deltaproteobacteria bacterium]|nr:type III-B CRISPR module RAMP protein Cmr6 [Deltaproteobacteria bacterium]